MELRDRDLRLSSGKRAMMLVEEILGDPVISALFFSAAGPAMTARGPLVSVESKVPALRFVLFAIVSRFGDDPHPAPSLASARTFVHFDMHDSK